MPTSLPGFDWCSTNHSNRFFWWFWPLSSFKILFLLTAKRWHCPKKVLLCQGENNCNSNVVSTLLVVVRWNSPCIPFCNNEPLSSFCKELQEKEIYIHLVPIFFEDAERRREHLVVLVFLMYRSRPFPAIFLMSFQVVMIVFVEQMRIIVGRILCNLILIGWYSYLLQWFI